MAGGEEIHLCEEPQIMSVDTLPSRRGVEPLSPSLGVVHSDVLLKCTGWKWGKSDYSGET